MFVLLQFQDDIPGKFFFLHFTKLAKQKLSILGDSAICLQMFWTFLLKAHVDVVSLFFG